MMTPHKESLDRELFERQTGALEATFAMRDSREIVRKIRAYSETCAIFEEIDDVYAFVETGGKLIDQARDLHAKLKEMKSFLSTGDE